MYKPNNMTTNKTWKSYPSAVLPAGHRLNNEKENKKKNANKITRQKNESKDNWNFKKIAKIFYIQIQT